MALTLDGSVVVNGDTGVDTVTGALTCSNAGNVICVCVLVNGTSVTSITGGGVTFTARATIGGSSKTELWTGYASGTFNSAITVNYAASTTYATVVAFGVNGAPSSSYFDTNAGLPVTDTTQPADPLSVSTTAADTFILGFFRLADFETANLAGSGWTLIHGAGYTLVEYRVVASAQTNLSVDMGSHVGNSANGIADALVQAGAGWAASSFPHLEAPAPIQRTWEVIAV